MEKAPLAAGSLEAFREVTMELDQIYSSLFPKTCRMPEAEYWSLLLIHEGVVTQSQISSQLSLSRQTLNSAFKQLQKKGLIRLEPYQSNQRAKQAFLTEEGEAFVKKYIFRMHQTEEKAWSRLTRQEQAQLSALTAKFRDLMLEELKAAVPDIT